LKTFEKRKKISVL